MLLKSSKILVFTINLALSIHFSAQCDFTNPLLISLGNSITKISDFNGHKFDNFDLLGTTSEDFFKTTENLNLLSFFQSPEIEELKKSSFLSKVDNLTAFKELIIKEIESIEMDTNWRNLEIYNQIKNAIFEEISEIEESGGVPTAADIKKSILVSRDPNKVKFKYYESNQNSSAVEVDIHDPLSVKKTNFNPAYPTVFITHGFTPVLKMLSTNYACSDIVDAYRQEKRKINIICVDWEYLARPRGVVKAFSYPAIVGNVPIVGARVGEFIQYLKSNGGLKISKLHLIGFSLGAHISGIAGQYSITNIGQKVQRITGLDPAAPLFWGNEADASLKKKLNKTDAVFVDIIHTNVRANGLYEPLGHVDFYPNGGGPIQPICVKIAFLKYVGMIHKLVCSHSQAYVYYAHSIINNISTCLCKFPDFKTCKKTWDEFDGECPTSVPFGEKAPSSAQGVYYLRLKT